MSLNSGKSVLPVRDFVYRVVLIILILAITLGLWYLRGALMLVFFTVIIAVALSGPVGILKRRGWSHTQAVLAVIGAVLGLLFLLSLIILPAFIRQISDLVEQLPSAWDDAQGRYNEAVEDVAFLPKLDAETLGQSDFGDILLSQVSTASRSILPFLNNIGGLFTNLLIIIVLSIYLLAEPRIYVEGLLTLAPRNYRPRAYEILQELVKAIRLSVGAQVLAMFIVGTLAYIGLTVIGVDNALALAVISGLLNFIPTFGAIIALLIAAVFTLATDADKLIPVIIWYLILQQAESNVITPRVVKNALELPGAVIIVTQIIAGALFGFLGIMLAVPLIAVILVLVRELYVYDILNSRKARVVAIQLEDGRKTHIISTEPYRPEELTPGETAQLLASGTDPFEHVQETHRIEIVSPAAEHIEQVSRDQQAVWVAILALIAAQGIALIRSIISSNGNSSSG